MKNEQREEIEILKKYIEEDDFYNKYKEIKEDEREGKIGGTHIVFCKAIDRVLSLIKEQQEELDKKDKQIDLMARAFKQDDVRTVEEIKQYFAGLVEKE